MKFLQKFFALFGGALLFLVVANAAVLAQTPNVANYVGADVIKPTLLMAPLDPSGNEFKNQLEVIKESFMRPNAAKIKQAKAEIDLTPALYSKVMGENFNEKKLPVTFAFLKRLGADMNGLVTAAKQHWKGPRPSDIDPTIKPEFDPPEKYAYPSRHTAVARIWAQVLAELVPEKTKELYVRTNEIAWNRVAVGLSFAYDLKGADHLTYLMMGALQTNERYRKDLAEAKAEIEKAGLGK